MDTPRELGQVEERGRRSVDRDTFGSRGLERLEQLRARLTDPNRYLKLRRIAIENLSAAA